MKTIKRNASDGENFFKFFTFFAGQFLHNNSKFLHCSVLIPFFHLFTDNKTKGCSQAREKSSRTRQQYSEGGIASHTEGLSLTPTRPASPLCFVAPSSKLKLTATNSYFSNCLIHPSLSRVGPERNEKRKSWTPSSGKGSFSRS